MGSGITRFRMLKEELYAHKIQKLIHLYLFTEYLLLAVAKSDLHM